MGNHTVRLAQLGFEVTGIDSSSVAISMAKEKASRAGVNCRFITADLIRSCPQDAEFEFAFEWEVLHHILPENRSDYIHSVYRMLKPGAKYLSVSFHRKDRYFGGKGRIRETPLGTILYFSTDREVKQLFSAHFTILEQKIIEVPGKSVPHLSHSIFMER